MSGDGTRKGCSIGGNDEVINSFMYNNRSNKVKLVIQWLTACSLMHNDDGIFNMSHLEAQSAEYKIFKFLSGSLTSIQILHSYP